MSYDLSIQNNPDAMAWAKLFCVSHPDCGLDEGEMLGWFANAMMAMHDHILKTGPLNGDHAQFLMDQERREEQGASQDEPRPLPLWARQPMINSGPSNPPSATLSRNPNIPEGAHVVVGSSIGWNTAAQPKHRIVQAWHDYAEHLTVLGSDGRIFWRTHNPEEWHEIATYPPGLEP